VRHQVFSQGHDLIKFGVDTVFAKEAELIIEVVIENLEIKKQVLSQVESFASDDAYLATNTSYLSVTELASCLQRPERFLGIHFFAPVPVMRLVELIRGDLTCDEAIAMAKEFAQVIGKTAVVVKKDSAGFLVNRINAAIRMEAYRCYDEGIASIEDIDAAMKLGLNHPMGPFELNDMSGLEIGLTGLNTLYEKTGEERWNAIDKVRELVAAGELGRKTGKGWYDYTSGEKKVREDL
jgi:3-hydroxybutyryl-CoA dehydrogenase